MSPGHPKKYLKSTSVKAWGCPRHPLFINKKAPGHFSIRYIFIASYIMCYSWSVFIFVVCFILFCLLFNKVGPHHILFWRETRSVLIAYERSSFHFHCFVSILFFEYFVQLQFFTHILFRDCQFALFMFEQLSGIFCLLSMRVISINWLVLEARKKFRVYSDANGSLFRLWHRLWHVVLDIIFIMNLLIMFIS